MMTTTTCLGLKSQDGILTIYQRVSLWIHVADAVPISIGINRVSSIMCMYVLTSVSHSSGSSSQDKAQTCGILSLVS